MKITVIMAAYLGDYPGAGKNREKKFIRAVKSFLNQTYEDKELIIVSDGCQLTTKICQENWKDNKEIRSIMIPKQVTLSGAIRNAGLALAGGDIITYLDSDDIIGKTHLQTIANQFGDVDWVYYDDYLVLDNTFKNFETRWVQPKYGKIGTSSISHLNPNKSEILNGLKWSNGYGHDYMFVLDLIQSGAKYKKLEKAPQYLVCHYRNADY
jgi:glycosyltransferase involved in cell wall biosynthesis